MTASISAGLALLNAFEASGRSGYRIDRASRQIATDSRQHWQDWHLPEGSLTISPEGVRPRSWRLNTNALEDILVFLREHPPEYLSGKTPGEIELLDAIAAGSNREDVPNVLDGDPDTYWEPEPPAENSDVDATWWFSIDLGRVVVADRIVVTFVGEGMGDPFYLFEVLTSDGLKPISAIAGQSLDYLPVLQVTEPNTSRRRFEVDFSEVPDETREMVVRSIQIVARGSRLDRGVRDHRCRARAPAAGIPGGCRRRRLHQDAQRRPRAAGSSRRTTSGFRSTGGDRSGTTGGSARGSPA